MSSSDENGMGQYAAGSTFAIEITLSDRVLKANPRVLAAGTGDNLRWSFSGKKFTIKFLENNPFDPHPPCTEILDPLVLHSDAKGILEQKIDPRASGKMTYEVILNEDPKLPPARGILLINVTAAVIIRGPVDPV